MIEKAYVHILNGSEQILCAVVAVSGKTARFRYGKSYLQRSDAFPLDPINLPLVDQEFNVTNKDGMFGVLMDMGADSWGRKLISRYHEKTPKNNLEMLLATGSMGVGSLMLSTSRQATKPKNYMFEIADIDALKRASKQVILNQDIDIAIRDKAIHDSGLGGARPKFTVIGDGKVYIAKFAKPNDALSFANLEHASLEIAKEMDINVAKSKIYEPKEQGNNVLLVERFDVASGLPRKHMISARSLFNQSVVNNKTAFKHYSYGRLAEIIQSKCGDRAISDSRELYRRMVFNVFLGNTDDHAQNHALAYDLEDKQWLLSPCYDIMPISNSKMHGIALGKHGREATLDNILSMHRMFCLSKSEAIKVIKQCQELQAELPVLFEKHGVSEQDALVAKKLLPSITKSLELKRDI
ncbi:type II toxin-antitoxin system HipA family toxin [Vibrio breoganii]